MYALSSADAGGAVVESPLAAVESAVALRARFCNESCSAFTTFAIVLSESAAPIAARGEAFFKYVTETLGAKHHAIIVPECVHNDRCIFTSEAVLPVIFPK